MIRILFRCDASLSIGSGHVIRCRTLARELQQLGAEILFLCRRQPGDLIALLEKDFRVLPLPEQTLTVCDGLRDRDLYSAWLGCSQSQDADDCLMALSSGGVGNIDWLVVDHYGLDSIWHSHVLKSFAGSTNFKTLVIDDLADRPHQADLLLDQNFFSTAMDDRYRDLIPSGCIQLLGPHYALLGPEYPQFRTLVPVRKELKRVLVFFGGADSDNLTGRALQALTDPALAHLSVDVVLGHQSLHRQVVQELVDQRQFTTLHSSLPTLAALIARADLAIGGGGATTWERACLRLPSLVVAVAANQLPFAQALADVGHHYLFGQSANVTVEYIRSVLLSLLDKFPPEFSTSYVTDGFGASRVASTMLGYEATSIDLRSASSGDKDLLLYWHNNLKLDPHISGSELVDMPINNELNIVDFDDPNQICLIVTAPNHCPIGYVKFYRQSVQLNSCIDKVDVSFLLDRSSYDYGLISEVIRRAFSVKEKLWGPTSDDTGKIITNSAYFARTVLKTDSPKLSSSSCDSLKLDSACITILSDSGSWINTYLSRLILALWQRGHAVRWIHEPSQLRRGDVCFLLSCGQLLSSEQLALHQHNLVVHESALPQGQGWSPMTWQILEGSRSIPVTLFEATAEVDAGQIYLQHQIDLIGNELVDEWRDLQAKSTLELCLEWVDRYKEVVASASPQVGESTYYSRRRKVDSMLDPDRCLAEQINLLRVVDNNSYPAFFYWGDKKFVIQVFAESV